MKRTAAVLVSCIMTIAMCSTALADVVNYDIDDILDDVTINSENEDGYLIYSSSGATSHHKIIVNGVKTTITLENVNIETSDGSSALEIGDDADVSLVISGTNSLSVTNSDDGAGIHVSGGTLTISGTDSGEDTLTVLNTDSDGATIGSDASEDFTGTITVNGGVTLNVGFEDVDGNYTSDGAAIGSGKYGDMSGTITINDGSVVNAYSPDYGAAIGSGESGFMSGDIIINGGTVYASNSSVGSGIGAGDMGDFHLGGGMSGDVVINGGSVTAVSESGPAIGTGDYGEMSGKIIINGGNVVANVLNSNAAIGGGDAGVSGDIIINGGTVRAHSLGNVGIGSNDDVVSGDITIGKDASVMLGGHNIIGSSFVSDGTIYIYKNSVIKAISVTDIDELKDAGILNDNMEVVLLGDDPSGHTYSLNKLDLVSRIRAAKSGEKVYANESELSKSKLPYYALEVLAEMDNVTLVVVASDGQTAEINSASVPKEGKNSFFTVDELLDMTK